MEQRVLRCALAAMLIMSAPIARPAQAAAPEKAFTFTVEPGRRVADVVAALSTRGITSTAAFLDVAANDDFPAYPFVPPRRRSLSRFEGLFTPGSYHIDLGGLPPAEACLKIVDRFLAASAERFARLDPGPSGSLYKDVILASIVQKEAAGGRDFDKVASVFENRIRLGMPLASCPAVEYALGYHRPFLLRSDILVDSPYNLYLHTGLPPTPIAAFSDDALRAVVHPANTPYLFFTFDWVQRALYFDSTYAGHQKNTAIARDNFIRTFGAKALTEKQPGVFYERAPDRAAG